MNRLIQQIGIHPLRRVASAGALGCTLALVPLAMLQPTEELNIATGADVSTSYVSGHEKLTAINDGYNPRRSGDRGPGAYGNWPRRGTQWVQYDWPKPITTAKVEVYWFDDRGGIRLPTGCRLLTWDGNAFVPVPGAEGLGLEGNRFNVTTFPKLTTSRLRLEFDSDGDFSTGILEWRVIDTGDSPNFAPKVEAGVDRIVVTPGKTHLAAKAIDDNKPNGKLEIRWSKKSGPGEVRFADPSQIETTATFGKPGTYQVQLSVSDGEESAVDTLKVQVDPPAPKQSLGRVQVAPYQIDSPFWGPRFKAQLTHWIPYIVRKMDDPTMREGGIQNFVQAGRKLKGATDVRHLGAPFANAWVYNAVESMCLAQMVDAKGDPEILAAQKFFRQKLAEWIPKILSAQEKDGYLQTMYTIQNIPRWVNPSDHEAYNFGYFIEAAMAHFEMSGRKDRTLLNPAIRAADCWVKNIGPAPKKAFHVEHQEPEQALVRLARLVEEVDGKGKGRPYVQLAKYFINERQEGHEYDQSHLPTRQQYEAVGHAVRAVYYYNGILEVAVETGDNDLHSAAKSLWNSIVNKKYYVTGGLGSGESSEGFGPEFSLRNGSYCESCASCGQVFFQHTMHRAYTDSQYADLLEEALFNNVLGAVDLAGDHYTYTNPLDSGSARYLWHVCPCCVGNIPRTMLMMPTWAYTTGDNSLFVNQFVGGRTHAGKADGVPVEVVQKTNYPWDGNVSLTVNPTKAKRFRLHVRVPDRTTSELYTPTPAVSGITGLTVNGKPVVAAKAKGYAVIERTWKKGDKVAFEMPMKPQIIRSDPRIAANVGRVALRYGPLVYNFESVDQDLDKVLDTKAPVQAVWDGKLLGGVMTLRGKFTDGTPAVAVPNYARLNRGGRSVVWIRGQ